jgi:TolB-like protein/Tfp pilus assembly protein PilF
MPGERVSFGPFVLDASAGTLLRQGVPVPIGYRGLLLLKALADRPGEVVSKTALMDAAWPGTVVEEGNLSVQIATLRKLLGDPPDGGEWITNLPRLGYRLNGTVQRDGTNTEASTELGPSIAVLPFASLSGDPEQAFFADGLTEDVITRLARLRWLFVASRSSSFSYKDKIPAPGEVARELRVRYVLEGSVRRSGQRLRITSLLSDGASGLQVWAENYDVELDDFFTLQDRISDAVIAAIEPRLLAAEHQRFRSRPPENLDAWGFVMKALPYAWTWASGAEIASAQALLLKAIAIEPAYPRANSLLAWTLAAQVQLGLVDPSELGRARPLAMQAIQHAPEDPWTHFCASYVLMVARDFDGAVAALNEAIDLNPSFALAHMMFGSVYGYAGHADEGLHHLRLAERMSPRDFSQPAIYATSGMCHFMAGRYAEAVALERRAVQLAPNFGTAWRTMAAAAGLGGDATTGAEAMAQARRLHPTLSLEWIERFHPIVRQADRARYAEGLKALGLT